MLGQIILSMAQNRPTGRLLFKDRTCLFSLVPSSPEAQTTGSPPTSTTTGESGDGVGGVRVSELHC